MRTAYMDCSAGAAGDMINGALIDAGVNIEYLKKMIKSLNIDELNEIRVFETMRCGIKTIKFKPVLKADKGQIKTVNAKFGDERHHNVSLHSHKHSHANEDHGENKGSHTHNHTHSHIHGDTHQHRHLAEICELIENSALTEKAKEDSIAVFRLLAEAEGNVHNKPADEIHFHEVGAVDSIVDVVSACVGFDYLEINNLVCSRISVGGGVVECTHGTVPVPAPATAKLIEGFPISGGPIDKELLTPTGAAIIRHFAKSFGTLPCMEIESQGYGAGTLEPTNFVNAVRIIVGKLQPDSHNKIERDQVCLFSYSIDDSSGESIAKHLEELNGMSEVLDANYVNLSMKKNRPGISLNVLCNVEYGKTVATKSLSSGVTLGVKKQIIERIKLNREIVEVETCYGTIPVKVGYFNGKAVFVKAEYEDCKRAGEKYGVSSSIVAAEAECKPK